MLCRVLPLGPAPEGTLTQREWPWYPFDRRNWGDNAGEPELRQEYESYAQGMALPSARTVAEKAHP
jgi:hypothetical protein